MLPNGTVHQGLAALVDPLPMIDLGELLEDIPAESSGHLVILDQVKDLTQGLDWHRCPAGPLVFR